MDLLAHNLHPPWTQIGQRTEIDSNMTSKASYCITAEFECVEDKAENGQSDLEGDTYR